MDKIKLMWETLYADAAGVDHSLGSIKKTFTEVWRLSYSEMKGEQEFRSWDDLLTGIMPPRSRGSRLEITARRLMTSTNGLLLRDQVLLVKTLTEVRNNLLLLTSDGWKAGQKHRVRSKVLDFEVLVWENTTTTFILDLDASSYHRSHLSNVP